MIKAKSMVAVNLSTLMAHSIKVPGETVREKVMVSSQPRMELSTRASGPMI